MTFGKYTEEICQEPTAGASALHVNLSPFVEEGRGLKEKADSCEKSSAYLMNSVKKIDPNGLSMRTLEECLVQIKDGITPQSCLKWSGGGYDIEWQNINSTRFVPQNRERIYTVGHNRRFGSRKILPLEGADGENHIQQIGNYLHTKTRDNPNQGRIYYIDGIAPCLNKMDGGGREPCVAMPTFVDLQLGGGIKTTKVSRTLVSRYNKGPTHRVGEISGVAEGRVWVIDRQGRKGKVVSPQGIVPTLRAQTHGNLPELCFKLPEGAENQGNGIYVELPEGFTVYAIWYEKEQCYVTVRKLTPKETFRLQGFSDDLFEKAQFVNSDSQLYKQAGNSVTVPIVEAIGRRI